MSTRRRRGATPALDALTRSEHSIVLADLLGRHPELRSEAEQAAQRLLDAGTVDGVADDVASALHGLPLEDLAGRSGRIRGRGYVHESEAAWELISEAIEPFLSDLRRRAEVGLGDAAAVLATGIVAGVYQSRNPKDGTVVAYAGPDALTELADEVIDEATKLGVAIPAGAADLYWPEWFELA